VCESRWALSSMQLPLLQPFTGVSHVGLCLVATLAIVLYRCVGYMAFV
jgi:hypothetical protein